MNSQLSLQDQLEAIVGLANKDGFYDGADLIRRTFLEKTNSNMEAHKTNMGKFYTQFDEETWSEAVSNHSFGFDTVQDAIEEANLEEQSVHFVVKTHTGQIVYDGYTKGLK